jgi:hypothetical protein
MNPNDKQSAKALREHMNASLRRMRRGADERKQENEQTVAAFRKRALNRRRFEVYYNRVHALAMRTYSRLDRVAATLLSRAPHAAYEENDPFWASMNEYVNTLESQLEQQLNVLLARFELGD